ncbi:MAG TPA: AAA family ATPase [Anaerolineae bacterium]|nr:AAA family ATPase [Anaerolineae bacterium]
MFQQFYGFTQLPFGREMRPNTLFASPSQQELIARLTFLLKQEGLGLITGDIGAGKSTAMRQFAATLDPNRYIVIYLNNPMIGIAGLFREILLALHHEIPFGRSRMVTTIRTALAELKARGRQPVIIIDEAHLLPPDAFEQFRLLLSDQMDSHSLASLLLVGQPPLRDILRLSRNQAFDQRVTIRYHLHPLDLTQTIAYIRHHLTTAGYQGQTLFTDDALTRIFDYTKGIPRQINQICTTALIAGMQDDKSILEESLIRKAIADIDCH